MDSNWAMNPPEGSKDRLRRLYAIGLFGVDATKRPANVEIFLVVSNRLNRIYAVRLRGVGLRAGLGNSIRDIFNF
jgi:hypothetical protein